MKLTSDLRTAAAAPPLLWCSPQLIAGVGPTTNSVLSGKQLAALRPLARAFRGLFLADLGSVSHAETFTDRYELTIPAADPSVGEICVWDDEDELTIHLGEHHHWHVPLYMYADESQATRPALAAATAIASNATLSRPWTALRSSACTTSIRC